MSVFIEGMVLEDEKEKEQQRLIQKEKEKSNQIGFRGRWANFDLNQNKEQKQDHIDSDLDQNKQQIEEVEQKIKVIQINEDKEQEKEQMKEQEKKNPNDALSRMRGSWANYQLNQNKEQKQDQADPETKEISNQGFDQNAKSISVEREKLKETEEKQKKIDNISGKIEVITKKKYDYQNLFKKYDDWFNNFFTNKYLNTETRSGERKDELNSFIQETLFRAPIQPKDNNQAKQIKQQNLEQFDNIFFPVIAPCHRRLMVQHIKNSQSKNKQSQQQWGYWNNEDQFKGEQQEIKSEERKLADEQLAEALMQIPPSRRAFLFQNASSSEDQDSPSGEQRKIMSNELISIYPPDWNVIESERRTALFAIYHCTSQKILPEDRISAIRSVLGFASPAMFQSSLILLEEEDVEFGIKKQDMHTGSYILSSMSQIGGSNKMWRWMIKEIQEKKYETFAS
ncbi:MAG: hypothetical protein EZS28_045049, partial [Streblomastix strix]